MTHPLMFLGLLFFFFAIKNFASFPFFVSRWIVLFSYVWVYFPAVIYMSGDEESLSYSLNLFSSSGQIFDREKLYPLAGFILLITSLQMVMPLKMRQRSAQMEVMSPARKHLESWWLVLCVLVWLSVAVAFLGEFRLTTIFQLFVPAYFEETKFKNYFLRLIFLYIPAGVFCVLISREGLTWRSFLALFVALAASLGSGQRRDAITVIILCIGLFYFGRKQIFLEARKIRSRVVVAVMFAGGTLSVMLWGARVAFTNYLETGKWINPFEYRSIIDVVLGSGATGPFAYLTVLEYVQRFSVHWGHSLYYGATQFIPRSLWSEKPLDIDSYIEAEFFLMANPSSFWMGDLYFSFGAFWWLVFIFVSFALDGFQRYAMAKSKILVALLNLSLLACSFALFKNGLGTYIVAVMSMFFGLAFCFFPRIFRVSF